MSTLPAQSPHNHSLCIEQALTTARSHCEKNKVRLTELRELVLELVWQSHQPLGAYQLMDMLRERYSGNVAPPTVYRALDFLQTQGLVHKLATLNAYIGCSQLSQLQNPPHQPSFFICEQCHNAMEVNTPRISQAIYEIASNNQFSAKDNAVEVMGLCNYCAKHNRTQQQQELIP